MTDFSEILQPGTVVAGLPVTSKKALFQQLAQIAEKHGGIDARMVIERLQERERLGSTGFGGGVAIPHGKIEGLGKVVGVYRRL